LLLTGAGTAVGQGRLEEAGQLVDQAAGVAGRLGAADLLAAVALALEPIGEPTWDGTVHHRCQLALGTSSFDEPVRARLLARAARAATYLGLHDEAVRDSAAALAAAEASHDVDALVEALNARQLATSGPDDVEELRGLAERMIRLGRQTGRPGVEMWGRLWLVDAHWYVAGLADIAAEAARMQRCVEQLGGPEPHWHLLRTRATLALARAEFDEARRLHDQGLQLLRAVGHPAVRGAAVAFGVQLGHHLGHDEVMLAAETWDFGTDLRWDLFARLDRALALLESGRADEAAAVYRRCGTPARWVVPRAARLVVLAVGIQVTAGLGVLDDLAVLREGLVPYRGRYVAAGWGAVHFLGPVDLFLGTAASALSEPEAAQELLAAAAVQCRDIGAPGLLVECACVRAEAAYRSGDRAAAARIAAETLPLAGRSAWVRGSTGCGLWQGARPTTG
jgi:tetratricopeptide (TPR) repeat protein